MSNYRRRQRRKDWKRRAEAAERIASFPPIFDFTPPRRIAVETYGAALIAELGEPGIEDRLAMRIAVGLKPYVFKNLRIGFGVNRAGEHCYTGHVEIAFVTPTHRYTTTLRG